ncbi:MAG TPA: hypothetical protein VJ456_17920 [Acidimicrobiia bacterium]|nr:hypothetical protein [Acidimicrobiia bacterium]
MAVVDITTFRLRAGVDDGTFLRTDERVRTAVLYQQPGIVRATTARGAGGDWLILVLWASDADADAASGALDDVVALAEPSTVDRRRYTTFD